MKLIENLFYSLLFGSLFLTSCADQVDEDYNEYEKLSLRAWVAQHNPEILDNFRKVGDSGYYFDILELGDEKTSPIGGDDMWVHFDYSARDLNGNLVLTRNADEAKLLNTFTKYTHYVPYYRFCGKENTSMMEGAYLAMRDTLEMSQAYFDKYKSERGFTSRKVRLREGSKVVLYCPSIVIGPAGVEGSGGYEGQSSLAAYRPVRVAMQICDTIKNPLKEEGNNVDLFCEQNGGLDIYKKEANPVPTDSTSVHHPHHPQSKRWVSACDTIAQVYVNYRFDPKTDRFNFQKPYNVGYAPYNDSDLERKISEALVKRFHSDEKPYVGVDKLPADTVKQDQEAKIWYIGRFLDGFIFDTNIDEVKKLIYDADYAKGSVLSYTPQSGGLIKAFFYSIANLRYGQWASFITVSTYAYGAGGKQGSTQTTTTGGSTGYDYFNYMNYMNNYYGNSYMGGYYDNYYGGYGGYGYGYGGGYYGNYYGDYYGNGAGNPTTTVKTTTTEIPSYEPLLFEFYIEPQSSK